MKLCNISGCGNKHLARGWCGTHYTRYQRHGSPHITKKHGMMNTSVYRTWERMKARCNNPKNHDYKNYGGRGIKVCDRWGNFRNFYEDMGDKPAGLQIDRINNDGNYEPGNCRWTTIKENNRNKRDTVLNMELADKIRNLYKRGMFPKEIAKKLNIKIHNVGGVLYHGCWE